MKTKDMGGGLSQDCVCHIPANGVMRMKVIFRADDLGMSEGINYGIAKTVAYGPITSVGLMPNMPAAVHGFALVAESGVSLGQHTNICLGRPVSDPASIPSLVDERGMFCSSRVIRARTEDTIVLEEAEREIQAQLDQFRMLTGRNPAYFEGHAVFSATFFQALQNVADCNGLFYINPMDPEWSAKWGVTCAKPYHLDERGLYDPCAYLFDDEADISCRTCSMLVFHPGYLDQYVIDHSSFTLIRPMETAFLVIDELAQWIERNHVQLVNFETYRDA